MRTLLDWRVTGQAASVAVSLAAAGLSRRAPDPPLDDGATFRGGSSAAAKRGHLGEAVEVWRAACVFAPNEPELASNLNPASTIASAVVSLQGARRS